MNTKYFKIGLGLILILGFNSCKKEMSASLENASDSSYESEELNYEDSEIETSDAEEKSDELFGLTFDERQDSIRKLKQHAQLDIEVDRLAESSLSIERNVLENKGFILRSNHYTNTIDYKSYEKGDSIIRIEQVLNRGEMLVRVPRKNVRNTLDNIRKELKYINGRLLENEDLTFKFLEEELAMKRAKIYGSELQGLSNQNGELDDKIELASTKAEANYIRDYAKLEQAKAEDSIEFATIEITLKGETEIRTRTEVNFNEYAAANAPSFFETAGKNLSNGWKYFVQFILFLMNFWVLILIVLGIISFVILKPKRKAKFVK